MINVSMKKRRQRRDEALWRKVLVSVVILLLSMGLFHCSSCSSVAAAARSRHPPPPPPSSPSPSPSPSAQQQQEEHHDGHDAYTDKEPSISTIKVHAWLMYISTGFLLPSGVLMARFMKGARNAGQQHSSKMVNTFYYIHLTLQTTGIVVLTCGAIYSFKNFGYKFERTHQKLGICLWSILWLQPILGILKPTYGGKLRPMWYAIHWLIGTGSIAACVIQMYMGMQMPELSRASRWSVHACEVVLFIQVACMAFVYLAQDRWSYMLEQGRGKHASPRSPLQSTVLLSPISYSVVPSAAISYPMRHYIPA